MDEAQLLSSCLSGKKAASLAQKRRDAELENAFRVGGEQASCLLVSRKGTYTLGWQPGLGGEAAAPGSGGSDAQTSPAVEALVNGNLGDV